jgi:hypothetical protein
VEGDMLFEWDEETKLTAEQMKEVEDAKKSPILYDEDSPELSDEELNRFVRVSKIRKEEFKQRA